MQVTLTKSFLDLVIAANKLCLQNLNNHLVSETHINNISNSQIDRIATFNKPHRKEVFLMWPMGLG